MKKLFPLTLMFLLLVSTTALYAAEYTGKEVKAKLASEEIEGDFMTVWANNFADEMKKWSNGKIDISVYPYGTIGDLRDINELTQIGVVQYVFSDYAWISSFVPQAQVLTLNYLFPKERFPELLQWIVINGEFMNFLEVKFREKGLVPLGIVYEGWQWLTTNKEINSLEDVKGQKLRVMSSKLLVEDYKAYGASPTPMGYGEVYSGLQMGLIDGQVNPMFADYSMKFFEVQDYFTQLWNEPFLGIPTVNMKFFDALTPDAQEKMRQFWKDAIIPAASWIDEKNSRDMEAIKKERPEIKFKELDEKAIAEFKKQAETVYPKFEELGGKDADKALELLLTDINNAKKELGIK